MSNKARKRLVLAHDPSWADIGKPAELAYRIGRESATDRLLLDTARPADEAASLKRWEKPVLPIGGGVLVKKRSEEHTSELQSLMRISYAVFCLKKKKTQQNKNSPSQHTPHINEETTDYI